MEEYPLNALDAPWSDLEWHPTGIGSGIVSWHGADHQTWSGVAPSGARVIAKAPRAHVTEAESIVRARISAGELYIGPRVLASVPELGVTVEESLGQDYQLATTLRMMMRPALVSATANQRRALWNSDAVLRPRDVGADVQVLLDGLAEKGISISPPLRRVADRLDQMRERVADGPKRVAGWMSSDLSDIQIDSQNRVLFTGGTGAGLVDPLADVGALLTALSPAVGTAPEIFQILWGDSHPGAYARARIWSIIVDLWMNLRALNAHHLDPGSPLSYSTYAMFRTWHAEHLLEVGELDDLILDARKGWR